VTRDGRPRPLVVVQLAGEATYVDRWIKPEEEILLGGGRHFRSSVRGGGRVAVAGLLQVEDE
jgi:hypothetical protein